MNSMVRERESHVSRLFIEVTPGIRRALELLAEASITLLDEIDAPVDELEEDPDFEVLNEDDEDTHDAEPQVEEPDLGWSEETGDIGRPPGLEGGDNDEDFVAPETSCGFGARSPWMDGHERSAQRALFDPRIAARPDTGRGWGQHPIPPFPHERAARPAFHIEAEIRRLNKVLVPVAAKRRRGLRKGSL